MKVCYIELCDLVVFQLVKVRGQSHCVLLVFASTFELRNCLLTITMGYPNLGSKGQVKLKFYSHGCKPR